MGSLLRRTLCGASVLACVTVGSTAVQADGVVNIYSLRQPYLIEPLLEAFTKETGIGTNVIFAESGLIERMAAEGANSPADVLLTADIGLLNSAVEHGVTQPVDSAVINANVPAQYRDPQGHWFALTTRARVIYASKERVPQEAISYEELADPKWKGKICVRSGQHPYNVALIASMIARHGEEKAKAWLEGFKNNLARKPGGNDRGQVKGVYSGECDLAIGNTYYMALMSTNEKEPEQKEWAASVRVLFPDQDGRGTHLNVSGMVLARHAPNKDSAVKLMEFLSTDEAQRIYAQGNNEYPVKEGVAWSEIVASWGEFKAEDVPLAEIAKRRKRASELVDEVGFDQGPST